MNLEEKSISGYTVLKSPPLLDLCLWSSLKLNARWKLLKSLGSLCAVKTDITEAFLEILMNYFPNSV